MFSGLWASPRPWARWAPQWWTLWRPARRRTRSRWMSSWPRLSRSTVAVVWESQCSTSFRNTFNPRLASFQSLQKKSLSWWYQIRRSHHLLLQRLAGKTSDLKDEKKSRTGLRCLLFPELVYRKLESNRNIFRWCLFTFNSFSIFVVFSFSFNYLLVRLLLFCLLLV